MTRGANRSLIAFGEALWDCVPRGLFLGGAPLNVAYHAQRLGCSAYPLTCVGRDFLGDETINRVKNAGLFIELIQRHPFLATGVAIAEIDASGSARYDIREPVAWDEIMISEADLSLVRKASVFVYGTLATRSESNRKLLERLLDECEGMKVCDVNLRKPYDDRERALELAKKADLVKLNDEELETLLGRSLKTSELEEAALECCSLIGCERLCVTLGGEGALACVGGDLFRVKGEPVEVADTIGAGDSFTAALSVSILEGLGMEECLRRSTQLGGFVASRDGAQPQYDPIDVFG